MNHMISLRLPDRGAVPERGFRFSVGLMTLCLVMLSVGSKPALSQTSYPMLMSIEPVAAQVGQTSEHVVKSRYTMRGAYRVLVSGTGVSGEVVDPEEEKNEKPKALLALTVRFSVDSNVLPGVRDVRIATPSGISTVGQLVVVSDRVVVETADNNGSETAQTVTLPATLCGRIEKAEDVDFFRFHADSGQTLSFHVQCMRLQNRIHDLQQHADPIISIRNSSGSTVAASDNQFFGDPFISHTFDQAGDYFFEIRDVRYQGNQYWGYCIEANGRPFATTAYPIAVAAKEPSTSLQLIGYALTGDGQSQLSISGDFVNGLQRLPVPVNSSDYQPMSLVITGQPTTSEADGDNQTAENAQAVTVPMGINGRIEVASDIDCFVFDAKQGQRYSFEVVARRAQSSLDPHLRILDEQGNQLQINDDMRLGKRSFADSIIENWLVPKDGRYVIEIRDLHLRGGDSFVYFIAATRSAAKFLLYADTDKTPLTPGTSGVVFVRAEKKNGFDGEIQLHVDGLPQGVTASCGRILAGKGQDGCIVFKAGAEVKQQVSEITISGTSSSQDAEGKTTNLKAEAVIYQEIYQPGGGRGHWPVTAHAVSVGSPSDLRGVTLSTHQVAIAAGKSTVIDVEIQRAEGFDKNVTLEVTLAHLSSVYGNSLPEGVSIDKAKSKTALTAGATRGKITLTASADAPAVEKQQIVVMANVSLNFVMKATYASDPVFVTVTR